MAYARDAVGEHSEIKPPEGMSRDQILQALPIGGNSAPVDLDAWEADEGVYGHEIVGFLRALMRGLDPQVWRYIHYGLTSSDLTEFDLHVAAQDHAEAMRVKFQVLRMALVTDADRWGVVGLERAGRTHGRTAERTTLSNQIEVHAYQAGRIAQEYGRYAQKAPFKRPGPTGVSDREPAFGGAVPSTQIIGRDWLLGWACTYLRAANVLEQIATWIRLGARSEIDEFTEGKASSRQGSSAMPGKANPIDSEKVCGLARVARGYFHNLSQCSSLWEDRDLSNSSTERVSVPGLAATVEHMADTMIDVWDNLIIDLGRIRTNAMLPGTSVNAWQMRVQARQGVGPIEASQIVQGEMKETQ